MIPPSQPGSDVETNDITTYQKVMKKFIIHIMRVCGDNRTGTKASCFALIKGGVSGSGFYCGQG